MGVAILTGIFGLVGVIVGGLLTEMRERRRERRSVLAAARLVQDEFSEGILNSFAIPEQPVNESVPRRVVIEEHLWLEHQVRLAEVLTASEWSDLLEGARRRSSFIQHLESKGENVIADSWTLALWDNFYDDGVIGSAALHRVAGVPWWKRRKLKRTRERERRERIETGPIEWRESLRQRSLKGRASL